MKDCDLALEQARAIIKGHSVLGPLALRVRINRRPGNRCPAGAWATVTSNGRIHAQADRVGTIQEWTQILAHLLLHLGLGHMRERDHPAAWNAACDIVVGRYLERLGLVHAAGIGQYDAWSGLSEDALYEVFCREGVPANLPTSATGTAPDLLPEVCAETPPDWTYLLRVGLRAGVKRALGRSAVSQSNGRIARDTPAQLARSWFIREYPLLSALASAFTIVEDIEICRRDGIAVAAVRPTLREIYVNPAAGLDGDECRFVVAHELLHVGLLHYRRRGGRHPFLWNVACDFVINGWLLEMGVGSQPPFGIVPAVGFRGMSAEAVYERIARRYAFPRGWGSFRGIGVGDILDGGDGEDSLELDAFARRTLVSGLQQHLRRGRGTVPAGLVEEVRGELRAPIAWDVLLGRWFDAHLAPPGWRRSYAQPSRRQSATPDIPRPRVVQREDEARTFGVVLDTSGSMQRPELAAALGAVAGYAMSRDVPAIRLVFCDAQPYDRGYVRPEELLDWVDIRGRGGTVLQPAIDMLESIGDFPASCPILIVTDGRCDSLAIRREHAFLLPPGQALPFQSAAPLFDMS